MKIQLDLNKLWARILSEIINGIDEVQKETFVDITDESKLIEIDEDRGVAIIAARNKFAKEILKTNYLVEIRDMFDLVTNTDFDIVFVVADEYKTTTKTKEKIINSEIIEKDTLLSKFKFDNFLVSKSNRVVFNASLAASSSPGNSAWNPLFIYGGSGMGKTHLVNAIGNKAKANFPNMNIKYIQANDFSKLVLEAFVNQNGEASKEVENIKDEYLKYDMLIVDDVQFLEGKTKTTEIFFHIFNSFLLYDKQVVLTSDKYPEEFRQFDDRILTRFISGVTLPIAPPDIETAKEIIRKKLIDVHFQEKNLLSEAALEYMAQNFSSNVRELESSLNKVIMYTVSYDEYERKQIDLDDVKEIFKGMTKNKRKGITVKSIISEVSKYYAVSFADIKSKSRTKNIATARHISIYLIRTLLDESLMNIGKEFDRDHSTIMSSVRKVERLNENDPAFSKAIHELTRKITN